MFFDYLYAFSDKEFIVVLLNLHGNDNEKINSVMYRTWHTF